MKSGQFSGHSSLRICASKVRQLAVEEGGGARRVHFDEQVVELAQDKALISCRRGADGSGHKYTEICEEGAGGQPSHVHSESVVYEFRPARRCAHLLVEREVRMPIVS